MSVGLTSWLPNSQPLEIRAVNGTQLLHSGQGQVLFQAQQTRSNTWDGVFELSGRPPSPLRGTLEENFKGGFKGNPSRGSSRVTLQGGLQG